MFTKSYNEATEVVVVGITPGEMLLETVEAAIADGQAHLPMAVGYSDEWALAGHVESGCEVLDLAEIGILKFNGMQLDRHYDAECRISLLGEK